METALVTEAGLDQTAMKNVLREDTGEIAFISANVRMELNASRRLVSVSVHRVIKADIAKNHVLLAFLDWNVAASVCAQMEQNVIILQATAYVYQGLLA